MLHLMEAGRPDNSLGLVTEQTSADVECRVSLGIERPKIPAQRSACELTAIDCEQ